MNELLYKALNEKNGVQRYVARRFLFNFFQRLGFHVVGDHFYELMPNTRVVSSKYVDEPRSLRGIDFRIGEYEARSLQLIKAYGGEYREARGKFGFREDNIYFWGFDALMLYLILRELKPARLVEVGQGSSTRIILSALERNTLETGQRVEFVSIDPYARFTKDQVPAGVDFQCLQQELQSVDVDLILKECRFLFIDSSHVYKFGSDVEFEFTRLYTSLSPKTMVHLHDIFSPYQYPLSWMVEQKWFWNEQYLLEAFLTFNNIFEVYMPVYFLHRQSKAFQEAVKGLKLDVDAQFRSSGQSFYILRR